MHGDSIQIFWLNNKQIYIFIARINISLWSLCEIPLSGTNRRHCNMALVFENLPGVSDKCNLLMQVMTTFNIGP